MAGADFLLAPLAELFYIYWYISFRMISGIDGENVNLLKDTVLINIEQLVAPYNSQDLASPPEISDHCPEIPSIPSAVVYSTL